MSQNISIIGSHSPVTDDSSSIQVREHSAEKMAQEALSDAPRSKDMGVGDEASPSDGRTALFDVFAGL